MREDWKSDITEKIDFLELQGFFEDNFFVEEGRFDNGKFFIKILDKKSPGYLQCECRPGSLYLDTILSPKRGTYLLLALFWYANQNSSIKWIDGNARTNDEELNSQEQLENWYRKFGFETISRDVDGTKMRAKVQNRPLSFRLDTVIKKVARHTVELMTTQSPLSASSHPLDRRSP